MLKVWLILNCDLLLVVFRFVETMKNVIGHRESERALQLGRLYGAEEALKVGLIDEVVPESTIVQHAKEELVKWLQVPGGSDFVHELEVMEGID